MKNKGDKRDVWEWLENLDRLSPEELEDYDDQETRKKETLNYWKEIKQHISTILKDIEWGLVEEALCILAVGSVLSLPLIAGLYMTGVGQYLDFRAWASEQPLLTKVGWCYKDALDRRTCNMVQEVPGSATDIRRFTITEGELK